jgi:hypothetical protein
MDFDLMIREIKKLSEVLSGKSSDVHVVFRGYSAGITKPWKVSCEAKEFEAENHDLAASMLLDFIRGELVRKMSFAEQEILKYKRALETPITKKPLEIVCAETASVN